MCERITNSAHAEMMMRHFSERTYELTTQEFKRQKMVVRQRDELRALDESEKDFQARKHKCEIKHLKKSRSMLIIRQNRWVLLLRRQKRELQEMNFPVSRTLENLLAIEYSLLCSSLHARATS